MKQNIAVMGKVGVWTSARHGIFSFAFCSLLLPFSCHMRRSFFQCLQLDASYCQVFYPVTVKKLIVLQEWTSASHSACISYIWSKLEWSVCFAKEMIVCSSCFFGLAFVPDRSSISNITAHANEFKFGKRWIGCRVTLLFHRGRGMLQMHLCALDLLKRSTNKSILTLSVGALH